MTDKTRDIPDNVRNVLVIMTDQHRTDTIGCLGNPHARTPVIDAMGESGFAFTHCFTPTAICTPARASLMTGKRPGKHQVLANPEWNIAYQVSIPKGTWTYTQELRDVGYNVGIVGKYHCGYNLPDEWFDLINPDLVELPENFGDSLIGKPPIQENYATYWSTSSFTNEQWKKLIAVYWGYTAMIDYEIGRILDDTAVFFCADHGEFTGSHRLNDKGPMMYDDIYNVPFIARIPGVSTVGRSDAFVSLIDLPATVLDIVGLDTSLVEDGRSIVDLTRGEDVEGWRQDIVCEFHGHHFPLQQRMLRTRDFKLVINPESINELYDLRLDPAEINNVYTVPVYDEIRRELATNLYLQLRERGDHSFAKWMAAMTDFDIPLVNTARSDLDEVTSD